MSDHSHDIHPRFPIDSTRVQRPRALTGGQALSKSLCTFVTRGVRIGNDDKAWNDPPVFAYTGVQGTPAAAAPKRNFLNKRVPYPQDGIKPPTAPTASGTEPPPLGQATLPGSSSKAANSGDPAEASNESDRNEAEGADDTSKATPAYSPEILKEETLSNLNKAVAQCAQNMEVSQWMLGIKHLILAAQAAQEKTVSDDTQEST
ncbi:hypothetical protein HPB50_026738 [Hyalomma asiaticum]|uniref:Uncharacterized protein n=1 Tax=Hyalomma asiaticum TaxID=266040 RepID=A0ACB7STQ1_HYAAI|nr:hypothetical protein HPB50_026738 [Hyalomma asiaticum]